MAAVRVGVGCLVTSREHAGCVLLGKRMGSHGAGTFALPGGHLELGESWELCATREVKEETNLTIDGVKLVYVTNDPNIGGNPEKHYITIFMTGHVTEESEELINLEPNKCECWNWVSWKELMDMRHDPNVTLFDPMIHLLEGLNTGSPSFLL